MMEVSRIAAVVHNVKARFPARVLVQQFVRGGRNLDGATFGVFQIPFKP